MKREASVNLFQYWNRLRDGRRAPRRTEIEPADIKTLLGDTFILESGPDGDASFRLAGTRLCAIYGRELKGVSFASLWTSKDGPTIDRLVRGVFEDKSVAVLTFHGTSESKQPLAMELLLLPLECGGGEQQRALGIVSSDTKPYWLGMDPIVQSLVQTVRVFDPDSEPTFQWKLPPTHVPPPVRREPVSAKAEFASSGIRRIRHLLVLQGGKAGQ
jgi:hypothetical protein